MQQFSIRRITAHLGFAVMRAAVRMLPATRIAVVHGFPDTEEISLRIAGELAGRLPSPWRVVLLCDDPVRTMRAYRITVPGGPPVSPVLRRSIAGFVLAARARLWVHTHGLYGSPPSSAGRCHVLVGHGHGPKRATRKNSRDHQHAADLAFTNVSVWGRTILRELGVPPRTPILIGASPRSDLAQRAGKVGDGSAAGTRQGPTRVLWLPTVRRTIAMARAQWQDGRSLVAGDELTAAIVRLQREVRRHGLELVTKVHELDADAEAFRSLGVPVVTTDDLLDDGVTFHQFVRESAALITDYSSVFVDHLDAGLPVAFWMPDGAEFDADRGFNEPDFRTVAPELLLRTDDDLSGLLAQVASGKDWQPGARARLAEAIGYVAGDGRATSRLVTAILAHAGIAAHRTHQDTGATAISP